MGNDLQQVGSPHQITNILNGKHLKVKKCNLTFEGDAYTDLEGLQTTKCVFSIGLKNQFFSLFSLFLLLFISPLYFFILFLDLTVIFQLFFNFI